MGRATRKVAGDVISRPILSRGDLLLRECGVPEGNGVMKQASSKDLGFTRKSRPLDPWNARMLTLLFVLGAAGALVVHGVRTSKAVDESN